MAKSKTYSKISKNTIEEIDVSKAPRALYDIKDLKDKRKKLLSQLKGIEDILRGGGELK